MKKNKKNAPFFAKFLEGQRINNPEEITGSGGTLKYPDKDELYTDKYPSDSDEFVTEKYPSDDDEYVTHKYPSDNEDMVTHKYPSDGDELSVE
jgi:Serine endopeptidase inhibitors